ncbi:uncharacterized protein B0P05DRAFT_566341 [Gilbertella persicaria]|uniref:uncharacterized protein n=1 Tax=Gilbertella persicaria TaxID=101096 RepID=UPI002220FC53|nr:uncharacterized protein B0P05DRAFT_566341 [Gilbertella persicaria]KAI8047293.1 hypothetical protein B0P05DRAFT_566341 [Gilbertella persicaria]
MQSKRSFGDAFISEANEKIVSLVAKEKGFQGIQPQALASFSNALGSYIETMFTKAHLYAELGNRSKPNIHDITRSLQDAGLDIAAFKDYLYTQHQYTNKTSCFKVNIKPSTLEQIPSFLPSDNEESDEEDMEGQEGGVPVYVPRHLPSFPSKHSFRQTPIYIDRPDDPQKVRELNSEQSRTVEENLKKLMSAENKLLKQSNGVSMDIFETSNLEQGMMMPIVNYEVFLQRRKKQKQSGTTLNVEGSDVPKQNTSVQEEHQDEIPTQEQDMNHHSA